MLSGLRPPQEGGGTRLSRNPISAALAERRDFVMQHSVRHGFLPTPNLSGSDRSCSDRDMLADMQTRFYFAHKVGCGHTIRC